MLVRSTLLLWIVGMTIPQSQCALHPITLQYIQEIVHAFEECSGKAFHGVIEPPIPYLSGEDNFKPEQFLLPSLLLWNPWITHSVFVNDQTLFCPLCRSEMCPGGWNDGSRLSQQLQPRTIQSFHEAVLLVSAYYTCQQDHILLAHDEAVVQLIPMQVEVPFILFYRTGFTRNLADTCISFCQRGINFYTLESILHEQRWNMYLRKRNVFQQYQLLGHCSGVTFPEFKDIPTSNSPSNNILTKCFLTHFLATETTYIKVLQSISVTSAISFDHTFKSAMNIGYSREDGVWIPQYNSLFMVFNKCGQIVTWQLTNRTTFDEVQPLLQALQQRSISQDQQIQIVYTDDCCKLRSKIQSVFGSNVEVKLDLFHAVQRITRTIPKRNPLSHSFFQDLRLAFRADGDTGKERRLPTPSPEILTTKIQNLIEKWTNAEHRHGERLITTATINAFDNLKKHITKGCLSFIPVGGGTNCNERFHSNLNSLVHRSRIGILLAYALITVLVHAYNHSSTISGKRVVTPVCAMECSRTLQTTPVGILPKYRDSMYDNGKDTWELDHSSIDSDYVTIVRVYLASLAKLNLGRSLAKMKLDVLFRTIHSFTLLDFMQVDTRSNTDFIDVNGYLIERGLSLTHICKDGNCFFNAIATSLLSNITCWRNTLLQCGLTSTHLDTHSVAQKLRDVFVNHLLGNNRQRYQSFFSEGPDEYERQVQQFKSNGFYNNDIGDFMPTAFSVILRTIIVVFDITDLNNPKFFTPEECTDANKPMIFLVYDPFPMASHYDVAVPFLQTETFSAASSKSVIPLIKCRCGVNSKDPRRKACQSSTSYPSRCKCLRQSKPCTDKCGCRNCGNPFGSISGQGALRKRVRKCQVNIPTASDFALERGEILSQSIWSDFEVIILQHILTMENSPDNILQLYTDIVKYAFSFVCTRPMPKDTVLRHKSLHQIKSKISHLNDTTL